MYQGVQFANMMNWWILSNHGFKALNSHCFRSLNFQGFVYDSSVSHAEIVMLRILDNGALHNINIYIYIYIYIII